MTRASRGGDGAAVGVPLDDRGLVAAASAHAATNGATNGAHGKGAPARSAPLTDMGNAERFVAQHGDRVRYVPTWKQWLLWDGVRWCPDERNEVHRLAKLTSRALWKEALKQRGDDRKDWVKWATRSEGAFAIRAMLECAMSEPGIAVLPAELDTHPWLVAVKNGVLDLRTGELRAHDRGLLMTKMVPVEYDPAATCPRWLAFLDRVFAGNEPLLWFIQRALGYTLTGDVGEQCLFFLHGTGANGKTVFLEVARALLGDYARQAEFSTFLERKGDGPRSDVARLFGARLVTSSEAGEGKRMNESLVKSLTGGDTVTARPLYANEFEFAPTFKLWLAANHHPVIRGADYGMWRRIKLVPFKVQIPEEERDEKLAEKLKAELPGVLTWAVWGCRLWQDFGLGTPDEVTAATESYRRDSDTLGAFLDECCVLDDGAETLATDLYRAYARWADEGGEFKLGQTEFGRRLTARNIEKVKRGVIYRSGVRLQDHARAATATASDYEARYR